MSKLVFVHLFKSRIDGVATDDDDYEDDVRVFLKTLK